jgi:hypothetical protein
LRNAPGHDGSSFNRHGGSFKAGFGKFANAAPDAPAGGR